MENNKELQFVIIIKQKEIYVEICVSLKYSENKHSSNKLYFKISFCKVLLTKPSHFLFIASKNMINLPYFITQKQNKKLLIIYITRYVN